MMVPRDIQITFESSSYIRITALCNLISLYNLMYLVYDLKLDYINIPG